MFKQVNFTERRKKRQLKAILNFSPWTAIVVETGRKDNEGEMFKELHEQEKLLITAYIDLLRDISQDPTRRRAPDQTPADFSGPVCKLSCCREYGDQDREQTEEQ